MDKLSPLQRETLANERRAAKAYLARKAAKRSPKRDSRKA